ncbi:predicted protein [Naegleria gruberi]|uniref:Predicted protein n=1 Tax=Naegleria gruberi TaxID=5762 RepID=D2V4B6_NAEGR|nr:uncharacterized protein NAEGRDRAFT_30959 [Naegleria gruberi]EFC48357.1 predicted protein [Naegleria gruberi]|eukprot:XP_002681101.1 predicted protein [Naegleria gruberi strain NEG-M]
MSIIVKLVELDNFSPYLPRILNVYSNIVEFEELECLPNLTEETLIDLVIDISKALHFLHENQIIHRDVKPANIMTRNFNHHCREQYVLIDFGLSFSYSKKDDHYIDNKTGKIVTANLGTSYYKAPEVNEERNYHEKIDIYSLGTSIIHLLMNSQKVQVTANWKQEAKDLIWQFLEFQQLVLRMVDVDPNNRPSALKVTECMTDIRHNLSN